MCRKRHRLKVLRDSSGLAVTDHNGGRFVLCVASSWGAKRHELSCRNGLQLHEVKYPPILGMFCVKLISEAIKQRKSVVWGHCGSVVSVSASWHTRGLVIDEQHRIVRRPAVVLLTLWTALSGSTVNAGDVHRHFRRASWPIKTSTCTEGYSNRWQTEVTHAIKRFYVTGTVNS